MSFIRFLLLALIIWILWRLLIHPKKQQTPLQKPNNPPPLINNGIMVCCDYCGLHLPENEAFHSGETWYCCQAHQHAAQNQ